jgi:hypothetical protein
MILNQWLECDYLKNGLMWLMFAPRLPYGQSGKMRNDFVFSGKEQKGSLTRYSRMVRDLANIERLEAVARELEEASRRPPRLTWELHQQSSAIFGLYV